MSKKLPSIPPVPARVAAAINRTTQVAINEAIAKKLYNCAPTTVPGSRRIFNEVDILGLRVFFHLCGVGFDHKQAGIMACHVRNWANATDVPNDLTLVEVQFPANWSFISGIPVYEDRHGNQMDFKRNPYKTERGIARSMVSIAVDGHLEDIRFVFQELIENGEITPVSPKKSQSEPDYAYDMVKGDK